MPPTVVNLAAACLHTAPTPLPSPNEKQSDGGGEGTVQEKERKDKASQWDVKRPV